MDGNLILKLYFKCHCLKYFIYYSKSEVKDCWKTVLNNKKKVVILCGGYGTRIRDVSEDIPKPMIPIGGKPILWHIMKSYAEFGYHDFILCLGYKSEVIKNFFVNYEFRRSDIMLTLGKKVEPVLSDVECDEAGWNITLAETGLNAMTGARD